MTVSSSVKGLLAVSLVPLTLLSACGSPPRDSDEPQAMTSQIAAFDCKAEADWFPQKQTPKPPFDDFEGNSNCAFHQWSWQAFLWLTQSVDGKPRFLSFESPAVLYGERDLGSGILPRMTKSSRPELVDEFLQAGTDGILTDLNGRAVYYSQYLDSTFAQFVTDHDLTDPGELASFDSGIPFPNGAMELKASWKIVQPNEDTGSFFTMPATVTLLANRNGKIVIDPDKTEEVTLALVGLHIAGRVEGHPEMIWATFEHDDNAPNVPAGATAETVVSDKDWTFYEAGTTFGECNQNPSNSASRQLDERTQTLTPVTQVCRLYEFGNDPDDAVNDRKAIKQNDTNIHDLNLQVKQQLRAESSVWSNYFEVGAIWFLNGDNFKANESLADDAFLTGSLKLSNATIETFTQTQSTMNNCFRCHNTNQRFPPEVTMTPLPGLEVDISHILVNGYFRSQQ